MQDWRSHLPAPGRLLVESFPHRDLAYTVFYTFEGWNANQSLGMLVTRRMEDRGLGPLPRSIDSPPSRPTDAHE